MKKNQSNESSSEPVSQKSIDSCVADLGRLTDTVGRGAKPLSTQERKRLPKPRRGGRALARDLAKLAVKYGVSSVVSVDEMLKSVDEAERIAPLDSASTNFAQLVRDQVLAADARSWKIATTIYTVLQRLAVDDADMARDLSGVAASFAKRPRLQAPAKSAESPSTTAEASPVAKPQG